MEMLSLRIAMSRDQRTSYCMRSTRRAEWIEGCPNPAVTLTTLTGQKSRPSTLPTAVLPVLTAMAAIPCPQVSNERASVEVGWEVRVVAKGWIVEVVRFESGCELTDIYAVAIADKDEAVATMRRQIASRHPVTLHAKEELSDGAYYAMGLTPGKILRRAHGNRR